jgi:hypothetical protein
MPIHGVAVESSDLGDLRGIQVDGNKLHDLEKFGPAGFERSAYLLTAAMT